MDELVRFVAQQTGLAEGTVRITVNLILYHLREKLPVPIADQLERVLRNIDEDESRDLLNGTMGRDRVKGPSLNS